MTLREQVDAMLDEKYRRAKEENDRLSASLTGLINITLSQAQVDAALSQMGQGGGYD